MSAAATGDLAAWLATAGAELAATIAAAPGETVRPTARARFTDSLAALGSLGPGALTVLQTLGRGGMGQVHLAEQTALHRLVAVKSLRPKVAETPGRRDDAALALLREAWITGSLEHPNVVPVHALGLDDAGLPVLVLKRIEGTEWSALLSDAEAVRARFGAADLLAWNLGILDRVLDALRLAHSRGILHRDLKPANVMIGEFGEVYLLDWGLAVSLRDDGSGRLPLAADAVELAGTPAYMAPEMLGALGGRRAAPLSERTDVYLAGAVLYELLAGHPPHRGDGALEVLASVARSEPALPDDVPDELARVCQRALRAEPAARFPSVEALQQALREFVTHAGSRRLAATAQARLDELAALAGASGGAATPDDAAGRRDRAYRLLGACRFGFQESLAAWPDNAAARAGLVTATTIVAELELADDDPRAALRLLGELDAPPPELLARARAAADDRARRDAELARLQRDHDLRIGTRTRTFLATLLGGLCGSAMLAFAQLSGPTGGRRYEGWLWWTLGVTVGGALLMTWARESMTKTLLNRRSIATVAVMLGGQAMLLLSGRALDVPLPAAEALMILLWTVVGAMAAIAIDVGLWPTAATGAAAYAVAVWWPSSLLYAMAAVNLVFAGNVALRWRPATLRWTDAERAQHRAERAARRAARARRPPG